MSSAAQPSGVNVGVGEDGYTFSPTASADPTVAVLEKEVAYLTREHERLLRENSRLRDLIRSRDDCRACGGIGVVEGFWLGTTKRCPACKGSGRRG